MRFFAIAVTADVCGCPIAIVKSHRVSATTARLAEYQPFARDRRATAGNRKVLNMFKTWQEPQGNRKELSTGITRRHSLCRHKHRKSLNLRSVYQLKIPKCFYRTKSDMYKRVCRLYSAVCRYVYKGDNNWRPT